MAADPLLMVFARARRAGQVKTRLVPAFGEQGALALYRQLLDHTLTLAGRFPGQVQLWLDLPDAGLEHRAARAGWPCCLQQGAGLGERMSRALRNGLQHHRQVLLIGSDCPRLDNDYLQQALAALEQRPVVFGASEDGGYVLLGGSRAGDWPAQRFRGVRFGGPHALQDSLACFPESRVTVLPPLWDVDEPEDVARARERGLLRLPGDGGH